MINAEVFRKLLNLGAMFIPILYHLMPEPSARLLLLMVTVVVVAVDFFRLHLNGVKEGFILFFGAFLRRRELSQLSGATYLLLGCLITALLFRKPIVVIACTFIIVGDTFAALFGQSLKSPKIFRKTLAGSLGFFCSSVLAVIVFYQLLGGVLPVDILVIVIGALAATVFEALTLPWDDNFAVPIFTGAIMSLVLLIL